MKTNKSNLAGILAAIVLSALLAACSEDAGRPSRSQAVADEPARVRVERGIDALKTGLAAGRVPAPGYFTGLAAELAELSREERSVVFEHVRVTFTSPCLSTRNLSERGVQLEGYLAVVRALAFAFDGRTGDREEVWDFLLRTLESVARERRMVGGAGFKADVPPVGMFVPTDMYLSRLDGWISQAVRRGFERGPFVAYYDGLDAERRREWVRKLERLAGRKVLIRSPGASRR